MSRADRRMPGIRRSRLRVWLALVLALLPALSLADRLGTRGVVQVETQAGETLELYAGSHALLIGVSDYKRGWSDLLSVPAELDRIQQVLAAQNFSVSRVHDPDSAELERAFKTFINRYGLDRRNRLLVFFSGHGYTDEDGLGYLVPADAPDPARDIQGLLSKALSMNQILAWARDLKAKHALMLFDSCFSGTVFKAKALPVHPPYITDSTAKRVRQFITAGDAGEEVPARSTFALVFAAAFEPAVPDPVRGQEYARGDLNRDGYVTGEELGIHLRTEVAKYEAQTPQYGKISDYWLSRGDFVFVSPPRRLARSRPTQPVPTDPAVEMKFWESMDRCGSLSCYRAYLKQYPSGSFAAAAQAQIARLEIKDPGKQSKKQFSDFFPPQVKKDTDSDGIPDLTDKCPGTPLGAPTDSDGCEVAILAITISHEVRDFDFDSAMLKPEMKKSLDEVAARLKESGGDEHLDIVGHTDSAGQAAYNQGLSERRAIAVADYLITRGIDPNTISTSGMGETQPIADNNTREGRAMNSRVEIRTR